MTVQKIEKIDIIEFRDSMDFSPGTVCKALSIVKQILDFAVDVGYIHSNPIFGVKKSHIKRSKKKTLKIEKIKQFLQLEDVKNAACYIAILILFGTGMRPGEVWIFTVITLFLKSGLTKKEGLQI